jgi:nitroimidazol reductase NimA-like FMN-containing flavoprotein (pyridoxamine 5'-phosphate oxidase superfamily)
VQVGRLAVVVDGRPEVYPVNYAVDHGTVVFRTAAGTKLAAAMESGYVAFEADGLDRSAGEAWSVLVKGRAEEIRDVEALIDAVELPLRPWQGSPKHRFVRVVADEVSGRRFAVADPSVWDSPYTLRRPSPWE